MPKPERGDLFDSRHAMMQDLNCTQDHIAKGDRNVQEHRSKYFVTFTVEVKFHLSAFIRAHSFLHFSDERVTDLHVAYHGTEFRMSLHQVSCSKTI